MTREIIVKNITIGGNRPFALIAGPCVIESGQVCLEIGQQLKKLGQDLNIPVVFKASFDKANRQSVSSFRGPGLAEGLDILAKVREKTGLPILSDVHEVQQVKPAGEVLDVIQIPAFLCRQTDLLIAVGRTGRAVNVKKGQFLAPSDMEHVVKKVLSTGNENILITERGSCFGYNQLVNDMRSLRIMRGFGFPVVFDASHSVQLPGGRGDASDGQREFILPLARAAVAVGVDGVFLEVHDQPERAQCDGPNSFPLEQVPALLDQVLRIQEMVKDWEGGPQGA